MYAYIAIYMGVGGLGVEVGKVGKVGIRSGLVRSSPKKIRDKKSGPVRSGKNPVGSGLVRDENPVRSERSVPERKIIVKSGPVQFWYIPDISSP